VNAAVIYSERLSKRYHRGVSKKLHSFTITSVALFVRLSPSAAQAETFWALKDVSINLHEGEVLGLIGRNGAARQLSIWIGKR
jgi:ABC-type polysaccharide/polyol phosphate transport system ATPase subunit